MDPLLVGMNCTAGYPIKFTVCMVNGTAQSLRHGARNRENLDLDPGHGGPSF